MKQYLKFLALTVVLFTAKAHSQLTISGPASLQVPNADTYTATCTADLTDYTFVWHVNNTNATVSGSGASVTLTGVTAGNVTLSVVAFKDNISAIYCDDYSVGITVPPDPCDNSYRITAVSCSSTVNANGWTFQLTNNGSPVSAPTAVWNSGIIPTHFIIDTPGGGTISGHPIPEHVIPSGETEPVFGFTVTCTYNGCTYVYEYAGNYVNNTCVGGRSGYITSGGQVVFH